MNKYLLTLYCFLNDKLKDCYNKDKYKYNKSLSVFYLDIYNDKYINVNHSNNTILERLNGVLKYFKEKNLCDLNLDDTFNELTKYKLIRIKPEIIENNNMYTYNYTIYYNINSDNSIKNKEINIKAEILKTNIIFKKYKNIKEILLIYKILGLDTGNFWGVNPSVYKYIANIMNNNVIECFASPFNHSLDNYYSVVKTDKKYGSKGNFFKNFLKASYECYLINPPFTAEIMIKVFDMIKIKLTKQECCIYLYIPTWEDLTIPFYEEIKKKYKILRHKWNIGQSYVFDYHNNKNMPAYFDLTFFLITNNMTDKYIDGYNPFIKLMSI
jgi:hypothetical protein